jgi:hypothetical protein
MIAAIAVAHQLSVHACNARDFDGIDDLEVIAVRHPDRARPGRTRHAATNHPAAGVRGLMVRVAPPTPNACAITWLSVSQAATGPNSSSVSGLSDAPVGGHQILPTGGHVDLPADGHSTALGDR